MSPPGAWDPVGILGPGRISPLGVGPAEGLGTGRLSPPGIGELEGIGIVCPPGMGTSINNWLQAALLNGLLQLTEDHHEKIAAGRGLPAGVARTWKWSARNWERLATRSRHLLRRGWRRVARSRHPASKNLLQDIPEATAAATRGAGRSRWSRRCGLAGFPSEHPGNEHPDENRQQLLQNLRSDPRLGLRPLSDRAADLGRAEDHREHVVARCSPLPPKRGFGIVIHRPQVSLLSP